MAERFAVVSDVDEIGRLNRALSKRLKQALPHQRVREITYPSGHASATVRFEHESGTGVRAWAAQANPRALLNFFLKGSPQTSDWLEITVQLNFPAVVYDRRFAGAFLRSESGTVLVAHRGKLTKGNAGLRKEAVFQEFGNRVIEAQDGTKKTKVIPIAGLDAPDLVDRLFEFASEARAVASKVALEAASPQQQVLMKLGQYFDEHAGEGSFKGHAGGRRNVTHGAIVKALQAARGGTNNSLKNQAIDLAIANDKEVHLYEVKTGADTTSVYTGVGQLLIHGEAIASVIGRPVKRYLVLPCAPKAAHLPYIVGKGETQVLTFNKGTDGYLFSLL